MKRTLFFAVLSALLVGCSEQQSGLTLALTGMEPGDSVAVFKSKITAGLRESEIDTFAIPDGNLFIPITAGEPQSYFILLLSGKTFLRYLN